MAKPRQKPAPQDDYEIGYGRPPRHSRFKPGQSGNPKGRPRGRKNVHTILEETLYRPVPITENGRKRKVPAIEAMFLGLLRKSLDGDLRAVSQISKLMTMLQAASAGATETKSGTPAYDPMQDADLLADFAAMVRESTNPNDEERDDEH